MRILTAAQMREADRRTIEEIGIPSIVLMENAGRQVVGAMEAAFDDLDQRRVAVLCGRGNNGGDGFVVARTLHQHGIDVGVFLLGQVADVEGDAKTNLNVLGRLGVTVVEIPDSEAWELHGPEITTHDLLVDAVFGTGLTKPLGGMLQTAVGDINSAELPVVAVDVPTGLAADTHELIGEAIQADVTVTLGAPKLPLVLPPGDSRVGDLVVADIGIPREVIDGVEGPRLALLTRAELRSVIPPRPSDAHKGDFGRVLVVAGSTGKTGAAHLAGLGALRSGAGLVTIATPRSCVPTVAAAAPEYMTLPLPESEDGHVGRDALSQLLELPCDVIAVGPGLGTGAGATALVHGLLDQATVPLVLDADALNAVVAEPGRLRGREGSALIITPHPGEMARLARTTTEQVQANRVETARGFATSQKLYVVLKGARTLIATPDGSVFVNLTGNPGMATGGTGDVLTGGTAAWVAQLLDAAAASKVAVHLHGLAGDLAAKSHGQVAMTATDLVAELGRAVTEMQQPVADPEA